MSKLLLRNVQQPLRYGSLHYGSITTMTNKLFASKNLVNHPSKQLRVSHFSSMAQLQEDDVTCTSTPVNLADVLTELDISASSENPQPGFQLTWHNGQKSYYHSQWLWHNSEQFYDSGTGQKMISPAEIPTSLYILQRARVIPRASLATNAQMDTHMDPHVDTQELVVEMVWSDGRITSIPLAFLAKNDYSPSTIAHKIEAAEALDVQISVCGEVVAEPGSSSPSNLLDLQRSTVSPVIRMSFDRLFETSDPHDSSDSLCDDIVDPPKPSSATHSTQHATNNSSYTIVHDDLHPPRVPVPQFQYEALMQPGEAGEYEIWRWLMAIDTHGLALVKGVPQEENQVLNVAKKVCEIQRTIYGETFDVKAVHNPINVAYSSNALELHQDLAYYESPPGLQFLHCLKFDSSVSGGESTFMDAHRIAYRLFERDPEAFQALCEIPVTLQKVHYARDRPTHMVYRRPHITLSAYSSLQGQAKYGQVGQRPAVTGVFWAPPFEGPLCVPHTSVEKYYHAYTSFAQLMKEMEEDALIELRLTPGDLISFNNRRMLHGRRAFNQPSNEDSQSHGIRHLQGCYVNIDEFKSRLAHLCHAKFGFHEPNMDNEAQLKDTANQFRKDLAARREATRTIRGVGNQCHL